MNKEIVDLRSKELDTAMVSVGKSKIFLFNWGDDNKLPWSKTLDQVYADKEILNDYILLTKNNSLILPSSSDSTKWSGQRNAYTDDINEIVDILYYNKVIDDQTKIYIGNWASKKGKLIGNIKQFKEKHDIPNQLVVYHGTSSDRVDDILEQGLKPVEMKLRQWKYKAKWHPEYNKESIYLTVDKWQATYYARKAVNVARNKGYKKIAPVVLKIVIDKKYYDNLRPDDDYIVKSGNKSATWMDSIKNFSQIAYVGTIPKEWISVYSTGNVVDDEEQVESIHFKNFYII